MIDAALKQLPFDYPTIIQPYIMKNMIIAAIKAAAEVEQEPAGFLGEDQDHGSTRICKHEVIADCWGIPYVPLYTHPQPKREPLNFEKINEIWESREFVNDGKLTINITTFVRLIEKAHGIGFE